MKQLEPELSLIVMFICELLITLSFNVFVAESGGANKRHRELARCTLQSSISDIERLPPATVSITADLMTCSYGFVVAATRPLAPRERGGASAWPPTP